MDDALGRDQAAALGLEVLSTADVVLAAERADLT
jgi:predicted nucleic acid-binding protein